MPFFCYPLQNAHDSTICMQRQWQRQKQVRGTHGPLPIKSWPDHIIISTSRLVSALPLLSCNCDLPCKLRGCEIERVILGLEELKEITVAINQGTFLRAALTFELTVTSATPVSSSPSRASGHVRLCQPKRTRFRA